jgi:hypothetical protein
MTIESTGSEPALVATPVVEEITSTAESTPAVTDANEKPVTTPPAEEPVQKRIDKLTWQARQAERDRDFWRAQAQQTPAQPAAEPETPKEPPKLADFDFDEVAYQKAVTEHVTAEAARQVREEFRKEQEQLTTKQRREAFLKRESAFAAKHEDYLEKTRDPSLPITTTMVELLQDTETGPEVFLYLANHPDEATRIAEMDDKAAARAIGRIEAKLEVPPASPAPVPAPKPVSKAPPPPPKIEAATEPSISKSWNDPTLTQEEFNKRRRQVIAQRR